MRVGCFSRTTLCRRSFGRVGLRLHVSCLQAHKHGTLHTAAQIWQHTRVRTIGRCTSTNRYRTVGTPLHSLQHSLHHSLQHSCSTPCTAGCGCASARARGSGCPQLPPQFPGCAFCQCTFLCARASIIKTSTKIDRPSSHPARAPDPHWSPASISTNNTRRLQPT